MNPLSLIPLKDWLYLAAIVAIAGALGLAVHHERKVGRDQVEAVRKAEHARAAAAAASAIQANQAETNRRTAATLEIVHATQVQAARVVDDAASAARERDAARVQLDAYVHRRAVPSDPAPSAGVPAAADPDVLLAGLLDEAWGRSLELAGEAEKRRTAGLGCQRGYQALTPAAGDQR